MLARGVVGVVGVVSIRGPVSVWGGVVLGVGQRAPARVAHVRVERVRGLDRGQRAALEAVRRGGQWGRRGCGSGLLLLVVVLMMF